MAYDVLRTLLDCMEVVRPALTQPGLRNGLIIMVGWILTNGRHAVTEALVATDVASRRHHEAFHRFFSRGTWNPDDIGRLLFQRLLTLLHEGDVIRGAIDDTLAEKRGPKVFGIACHIDPVRSTKALKLFSFGHVWVVLTVVVSVPFSKRPWSLPVLFRLYRGKKECESKGHAYRKKTELAKEMLDIFVSWADGRAVRMTADEAYCNSTVLVDLPDSVPFFGAMRPDAALTAPPPKRQKTKKGGRPRVRGKPLPKPEAMALNGRGWKRCLVELYGSCRTVEYKTVCTQWYRVCGGHLVRVVVVRVNQGRIKFRVFFSTDPTLSVPEILEAYAERWSIEVCFRDLKQLLGFSDSSARKKEAVERTAPFVGYIYTILVLWFMAGAHDTPVATPPVRPWYTHKEGSSFADVLRAAQRALLPLDVLDPARSLDNLRELPGDTHRTPGDELRPAA